MARPTLHLRPKTSGRDAPHPPRAADTATHTATHTDANRDGSNDLRHAPDPSAERGPEPGRDSRRGRRPRGPYPTGNT